MEDAELWLEKANEDFNTAEFNMKNGKFSYAAFLFQQSIEKGLKAILIKKNKGLSKTHDCFVLAKKAGAPDYIVQQADIITPYYFRTRYPDSSLINFDKEDVKRISSSAKEVLSWIKKNF